MRFLFLSLIIIFSCITTFSQIRVIDVNTKIAVSGVKVSSSQGNEAISDHHGIIPINPSIADTIILTHPGYQTAFIPLEDVHQTITVELIPDIVHLQETVISAGKMNLKLIQTPSRVEIIQLTDVPTLLDVTGNSILYAIPGLTLQEGAHNTSRITIRGNGSRNPYGTNRVKAFLGDIPLTNGEGITVLEDISPTSLGRVEIIKGPSHLYGSGTGGVIILHPRYPQNQGSSLTLGQSIGAFNTFNSSAALTHKRKKWALNTHLSQVSSDGFRENHQFRRKNALITSNYIGTNHHYQLLFNYSDVYGEIPSSLNADDFEETPEKAASNWLAVQGHEKYNKFTGGLSIKSDLNRKLQNAFTLYGNVSDHYESRPFNILDDQSGIVGIREFLNYSSGNLHFLIGTELMREVFKWKTFTTNEGDPGNLINNYKEIRIQNDNAIGLRYDFNAQLSLQGSLTGSIYSYRLLTLDSQNEIQESYKSKLILSPGTAINYLPNKNIRLFLSYSEGYSPASVEESLLPEGMINPDLLPETTRSVELGTDVSLISDRLNIQTSFYRTWVEDMLVNKRITEDQFMAINAGKTLLQGIEFKKSLGIFNTPEHDLTTELSFNLSDNRFIHFIDDEFDYSNNHLPAIPNYQINASLNYSFYNKAFLKASFHRTGKQFLNDSNTQTYEGYSLLNFDASYRLFIGENISLKIFGRIRNVLNTSFASMLVPNARAFGNALPRYYYPGMPRSYTIGLNLSLKKEH